MNNYYHIEGTEDFGFSTINRCLYSFNLFMNTVKRVAERYCCASVHDLNGYVAHFCYRRLKAFDTLIKVVVKQNDYLSSACLLRMLGDSVAVFNQIYMEADKDLLWLRHALYVIDGCEQNLKVLPDNDCNRGTMPEEELKIFNDKLSYNIELRNSLMNEAQQILDASPLQNKDKEAFDKIVKDRNWKFKEFKFYKRKGDNQYKWAELYQKIGRSDNYDVLSFLSQYVHSLSMSNIVMDMNAENRDGIIAEVIALIEKLNGYTQNFFAKDIVYIVEGLLIPEMRDKILACYDDEHRPSVEQWNEIVKGDIKRILNESK